MYRLEVLQSQWVVLALFSGLALMLYTILSYLAIWTTREQAAAEQRGEAGQRTPLLPWLRSFMPWALILLIVAAEVFLVVFVLSFVVEPPRW